MSCQFGRLKTLFVFTAGVLSLPSNVDFSLIGNNDLAHCVRHNLFSILLETVHLLIRLIFELPLCKSLGNKLTHSAIYFKSNAKYA